MDMIRNQFSSGRRDMIDAFAELTALARAAGVDSTRITALHGKFFDGNVAVKRAFSAAQLMPRNYTTGA